MNYVREFLQQHLSQIRLVEPEGTYLIWLDCSRRYLSHGELEKLIADEAGLWLDSGVMFGKETKRGDGETAKSLGGTESLLTYPLTQTHGDVLEELRKKNGITDCLLRLSVGIENAEGLIQDLEWPIHKGEK